MLEKCVLTILELNWNQRLGHRRTKLNICHHMLTSSTQLQNRSFHVVERTRTSSKCQKMKYARAKRAKILFSIVKYANLWGSSCRRCRGCLKLPVVSNFRHCSQALKASHDSSTFVLDRKQPSKDSRLRVTQFDLLNCGRSRYSINPPWTISQSISTCFFFSRIIRYAFESKIDQTHTNSS